MKNIMLILTVLFIAVISTACINNFAVQELNNKAKIYLENGDYENAINRLEASIDLDNTIFETHYNLGIAYIKAKKFAKAVKTLTKATEINSNNADAYYSLAVAQQSYADEIIEIKENAQIKDDEESDIENITSSVEPTIYNMSKIERQQMAVNLYNNSIESYQKYLELSPNAKDAGDINNQINEITEEINKLGETK